MNSYEPLTRPLKAASTVTVRSERRRRWRIEEKLAIVRETLAPGAVIKTVAERHGISTGLLFTWRKQMLQSAMTGFVPVQVAPEEAPMLPAPSPACEPSASPNSSVSLDGIIDVELPGGARVRVGAGVELRLLQGVLAVLGGR